MSRRNVRNPPARPTSPRGRNFAPGGRDRAARPAAPRRCASAAEILEDRRLLTFFTVTTGADLVARDGEVSLREALTAANTDRAFFDAAAGQDGVTDRIRFAPSVQRVVLRAGLTIEAGVFIAGRDFDDGRARVTIAGAGSDVRLFDVKVRAGQQVAFAGVTLEGGNTAGAGGAVRFLETDLDTGNLSVRAGLSFFDVGLLGNRADSGGGAVFQSGGRLAFDESVARDNLAGSAGDDRVGDGGAFLLENVNIGSMLNSSLSANRATGLGGAIAARNGGDFTVVATAFSDNAARGNGGAVYREAGRISFQGSTFTGNRSARSGGAVAAFGDSTAGDNRPTDNREEIDSGLKVDNNRVPAGNAVRFRGCVFQGNGAGAGSGAIDVVAANLRVTDTQFLGNRAGGAGGGAVGAFLSQAIFSRCEFVGNREVSRRASVEDAPVGGGAIVAFGSFLDIDLSDLRDNRAGDGGAVLGVQTVFITKRSEFAGNHAGSRGGAVAVFARPIGDLPLQLGFNAAALQVQGTEFRGNVAESGGALSLSDTTAVVRNASLFRGNRAGRGGAIAGTGSFLRTAVEERFRAEGTEVVFRGNVAAVDGGAVFLSDRSNLRAADTTFVGNRASAGSGGAVHASGSQILVQDVSFTGNRASVERDGGGGAVAAAGGYLDIDRSVFRDNRAGRGGAVLSERSLFISKQSGYEENRARSGGGAVAVAGTNPRDFGLQRRVPAEQDFVLSALFRSSDFTRNGAGAGGAVSLSDADAAVQNGSTFRGNRAVRGGAIAAEGSFLRAQFGADAENGGGEIEFRGNEASVDGGALHLAAGSDLRATDTEFAGNRASAGSGGAIHASDGALVIQEARFTGNRAAVRGGNGGGAVALSAGYLVADRITFTDNRAGRGGAILSEDSTFITVRSEYRGNRAAAEGGAVRVSGASSGTLPLQDGITDLDGLIRRSIFTGNEAGSGGALSVHAASAAIELGSFFGGNRATRGGAVTADLAAVRVEQTAFRANAAGADGGALFANQSDVSLLAVDARDNSARRGGAFFATAGRAARVVDGEELPARLVIDRDDSGRSVVRGNSAAFGGGVYLEGRLSGTLANTRFEGNRAGEDGGAVYNLSDFSLAVGSDFVDNRATGDGGAIFNDGRADVDPPGDPASRFFRNGAGGEGGAIFGSAGSVTSLGDAGFGRNSPGALGGPGRFSRTR